jgi:hypothetical protein
LKNLGYDALKSRLTQAGLSDEVAENFCKKVGVTYIDMLPSYQKLFKDGKTVELFNQLKKTSAFPKIGNTIKKNHADLQIEYNRDYPGMANYPYDLSTPVTEFLIDEPAYFVRVYSGERLYPSKWIFRIEDLRQYSSMDEIMEKLALPSKPNKIALVEVPAGTKLRKSTAGPQVWNNGLKQNGGAIQYEIKGINMRSNPSCNDWFKPLFETENEVIEFFNK